MKKYVISTDRGFVTTEAKNKNKAVGKVLDAYPKRKVNDVRVLKFDLLFSSYENIL